MRPVGYIDPIGKPVTFDYQVRAREPLLHNQRYRS